MRQGGIDPLTKILRTPLGTPRDALDPYPWSRSVLRATETDINAVLYTSLLAYIAVPKQETKKNKRKRNTRRRT